MAISIQTRAKLRQRLAALLAMLAGAIVVFSSNNAAALPSFSMQTDQPCSACHMGAFGPRLKQQGRDFKLYGYVANDTKEHSIPISVLAEGSYTHTARGQIANVLAGYQANDNVTFDEIALFYGGKVLDKVGAFIEVTYDAIEKSLHWEDFDLRYTDEIKVFGSDAVFGLTLNNAPTVSDLWQAQPSWSFPFASSAHAEAPMASVVMEQLPQTVMGLGAYSLLGDSIYLEGDIYQGLDRSVLRIVGESPINGGDRMASPAFYWRAVYQREFGEGQHYLEAGFYGLVAELRPGGIAAFGADHYTDIAFDASYQWVPHPELSTSDMLSLYAAYLHEDADLNASTIISGTLPKGSLSEWHAEIAYDFGATVTPTVQYFHIDGTSDPVRWPTLTGSPNSAGWVAEVDYSPWGKPDSPLAWLNVRVALQYTAYTRFDGSTVGASDFNTLFLHFKVGAAANR